MAKLSKKAPTKTPTKTKQDRSAKPPELSPVYFLSLEVENVLCFKDRQVLDLTDKHGNPAQWTVILGDNGVGKTTLLRCLAEMQVAKVVDHESSTRIETLYCAVPILSKSGWLEFLCLANDNLHISTEVTNSTLLSEMEISSGTTDLEHREIYVEIGSPPTELPWEEFQGLICYGYGAVRRLGSGALNESVSSENSLSLFSDNVSLINAEEWLLQTDYGSLSASGEVRDRLKKQITQIFDILNRILPDVDDIKIAPATEDNPHPRAEFLTPYGWVHINNLGLGYRTAIAWMVDLAVRLFRRYPHSPDPLAEPAIVLVDEIDLHLHPRWQRTIMDFLTDRFPNTQFIVTAHSPLVVQAAQNANIVLLRREGDRVVIDNDPEIIKNWRVDQVLTSVFELPSSRPPHIEPLLKRHEEILAKAHLTQEDEAELANLADQIGPLPTAETPEDIEAMDIIRQAAKLLKNA